MRVPRNNPITTPPNIPVMDILRFHRTVLISAIAGDYWELIQRSMEAHESGDVRTRTAGDGRVLGVPILGAEYLADILFRNETIKPLFGGPGKWPG